MAVSKVILNNTTLIDATTATATAADITSPKTAMLADGVMTTGTGSGGGGSDDSKNVLFIDYDGEELYQYTTEELRAMNALPANPSHAGLTAQGWNWSLADAKAYVTAYPEADLVIGQNYVTSDGKTRIYIYVDDLTDVSTPFYLRFTATDDGGVKIDWGDNSSAEYSTGTDAATYSHIYSSVGEYVVTLEAETGSYSFTTYINGPTSTDTWISRRRIRKVEIGSNVSVGTYTFSYCVCLQTVTIPTTAGLSGNYIFQDCRNLLAAVVPTGVTSMGNSVFIYCNSINYVSFPNGLVTVGSSFFNNKCGIKRVTIPNSVTTIGGSFLQYAYRLKNLTIPSSLTTVTSSTDSAYFAQYSSVEKVEIFSGADLKRYAFAYTNLKTAIIHTGVTAITTSEFSGCYGLEKVIIASSVTSIGQYAFQSCATISEFHLQGTTPPTLYDAAAINASNLAGCIYFVPYSADHSVLATYKNDTNWSTFADRIFEEPQS